MKKITFLLLFAIALISCEKDSELTPLDNMNSLETRGAKVTICHLTGNGEFKQKEINENAVSAHLAHGDAFPGTCYDNGLFMGYDCQLIDVSQVAEIYTDDIDNNCNGVVGYIETTVVNSPCTSCRPGTSGDYRNINNDRCRDFPNGPPNTSWIRCTTTVVTYID